MFCFHFRSCRIRLYSMISLSLSHTHTVSRRRLIKQSEAANQSEAAISNWGLLHFCVLLWFLVFPPFNGHSNLLWFQNAETNKIIVPTASNLVVPYARASHLRQKVRPRTGPPASRGSCRGISKCKVQGQPRSPDSTLNRECA